MKGKALLYVRVSSKGQEDNYSKDAQKKLGHEYARRIEVEIVKTYNVVESAWRTDRVAFKQMVEYSKKHTDIEHIIFDVPDRMTRNDFDKNKIYTLVKEYGKTIHFSRSNRHWNKESGTEEEFMLDIEVANAKRLSSDISRKCRMGMTEKAEQGEYPSTAPIGYLNHRISKDETEIIVDSLKAPLIRRLFELMATGHYSLSMLVETMRKEGLRNRKGNPLQETAISYLLRNPFYFGIFKWKGKIYSNGKHEPIISKQLFDTVREVISDKTRPTTKGKHFPFNQLLTCHICGCRILGEEKKRKYHYYHCSFSKGRHHGKVYVREEKLRELFLEPLKRITIDRQTTDWLMEALMADFRPAVELRKKQMDSLNYQLSVANNRISKLYDSKFDGGLAEEVFVTKEREYKGQVIELKSKLAELERVNPNFEADASRALELCNRLCSLYVAANDEEKVKILKLVASNFILNDVSVEAVYRKPFGFIAEGPLFGVKLPELVGNKNL